MKEERFTQLAAIVQHICPDASVFNNGTPALITLPDSLEPGTRSEAMVWQYTTQRITTTLEAEGFQVDNWTTSETFVSDGDEWLHMMFLIGAIRNIRKQPMPASLPWLPCYCLADPPGLDRVRALVEHYQRQEQMTATYRPIVHIELPQPPNRRSHAWFIQTILAHLGVSPATSPDDADLLESQLLLQLMRWRTEIVILSNVHHLTPTSRHHLKPSEAGFLRTLIRDNWETGKGLLLVGDLDALERISALDEFNGVRWYQVQFPSMDDEGPINIP